MSTSVMPPSGKTTRANPDLILGIALLKFLAVFLMLSLDTTMQSEE
ncbi:Hypothetical Protein SLY_0094 [Strawberry lethal yellows phytoplasma (CPA) str. NZSb11]|uniref:Uncharacterized protein n=1 Tax=Strawberry lethal yellows phytoplasma (CPA) str. NZSb11 TaxID=980422 RepID=R4RNI9_PHYAS|nr:Hypothetical Protein SLY_0094 [Strawberry lethal yellows phytoplasma (CPA) str. NZSb11]